jgi:hypothetical protein
VEIINLFAIAFTEGIVVPPVKRWPGAGYGFSFHAWVQLSPDDSIKADNQQSQRTRRQLFK